MCKGSDTLDITVSSTIEPITDTTLQATSAMDHDEPDYPFWHVIFWVSPHFQAFVVSASVILFALPVSYLTGIISFIKQLSQCGHAIQNNVKFQTVEFSVLKKILENQ